VTTQEWQLDITGICPSCKANWKGPAIPEKYREKFYGGSTHYSRLIGMEDPTIYDGAHSWMCPDCRIIIPRITFYHFKWKLKMMNSGAAESLSFWNKGEYELKIGQQDQ